MSTRQSFLRALAERARWYDLPLLASVPAVLFAVYALPDAVKYDYVLSYTDPTLVTLYTSSFVHIARPHLVANVSTYVLLAGATYLLATLSGRRARFYAAFITFLTVFPVVLSLLNLAFIRPRIGYGFSGVNMAFVGLLPTMLVGYVSRQFTAEVLDSHAPALFFVGTGVIALIAVPSRIGALAVAVVAGAGVLLYVRDIYADVSDLSIAGFQHALTPAGHLELAALSLVLFVGAPFAAFTTVSFGDGTVLNLYSHLLGYCLGYLAPYLTIRLVSL
mgnify:CR=1 FL=1